MELKEIMALSRFAVLGDTLNPEKYAYKINDIPDDIDVIDLCIHPTKGLNLLQECKKPFRCVLIQPGASDEALLAYLQQHHIPYLDGCVLVGLRLYT